MKKIKSISLMFAMVSVFLVACGQTSEEQLVGLWTNSSGEKVIEINKDETAQLVTDGITYSGSWEYKDKDDVTYIYIDFKGYPDAWAEIPEGKFEDLLFDGETASGRVWKEEYYSRK